MKILSAKIIHVGSQILGKNGHLSWGIPYGKSKKQVEKLNGEIRISRGSHTSQLYISQPISR